MDGCKRSVLILCPGRAKSFTSEIEGERERGGPEKKVGAGGGGSTCFG